MESLLTPTFAGIAFYMLILVAIGVVASRRMKSIGDYFVAGKSLGFWSVAFSARATGESAWLLLGLTGMGAMIGVKAFWVVLGELIGVTLAWLWMSKRFKRLTDRYDSITVPDYLEARFRDAGQGLRKIAAIALVVFVTIYVSAQIDATGKAFESFLGWDYFVGAIVGFTVVLAYIGTGGFLAVAWSDVFQGALMFLGLVALPLVAIGLVGGFGELGGQLTAIDPNLTDVTGGKGWGVASVFGILSLALIGLGFLGSPQIFVRFIALKDEREIPKGAATAIVWTLLADSGAVLIGMIGRAAFTGGEATRLMASKGEAVLPMLVEATMPALLVGLYIAVVLAAIMSTVDSLLVVAGSAWTRDWYQKVKNPHLKDDELLGVSRKATIVLAVAALAVSLTVAVISPDRTIFWFVIFGWSGIAATFCPTIILSLFWKGMTARGAKAAMIVGFLGVPIFKFLVPKIPEVGPIIAELSELPPAFLLSFVAGWLVSRGDRAGQAKMAEVAEELDAAGR